MYIEQLTLKSCAAYFPFDEIEISCRAYWHKLREQDKSHRLRIKNYQTVKWTGLLETETWTDLAI
jgi:hypothetical protein